MYFTFYKNTLMVIVCTMVVAFSGCAHKPRPIGLLGVSKVSRLDEAHLAYERGEYYKARIQAQELLKQDPDNIAAQQLMGDVVDKEITRQKEALLASQIAVTTDSDSEDFSNKNQVEIKTWLDRSKALMHQNQYDLALFAAEKVFIYDANNHEASLLIDDIRDAAIKNGKSETLFLSKMYQDEIADRVKKYRGQASELIEQNKVEQAKFALQKILMLEPEDPDSLRLFQSLQSQGANQ